MKKDETVGREIRKDNNKPDNQDTAAPTEGVTETDENYVRALETTVRMLKAKMELHERAVAGIKQSLDDMVEMQRLASAISTTTDRVAVLDSLLELTRKVIPVDEVMLFEVRKPRSQARPFIPTCSDYMLTASRRLLEEGILDWVIDQKLTTVVPDPNTSAVRGNFVVVPLVLRGEAFGVYIIRTVKVRGTLSDYELTMLGVLANQAAVAVENLRNMDHMLKAAGGSKMSEAQMLQAAKLASLGELVGGIAHEINNPLQILLGHLALLRQGKDTEHRIEVVRTQVQRIAHITRQLASFSSNVLEVVENEPMNVNWALNEVIELVEYQFKSRGIEVEMRMSEELPPLDSNKNYLQQAFLNLLINAKEAMPKGGKLVVSTEYIDGKIYIRFTDSGAGIKKENLTKIFDPFFTTKEAGKGTGLGLPVARGIVAKFGGELKVESVEGHGTTLTLVLPVKRSEASLNREMY